jgi:hypothetical protein
MKTLLMLLIAYAIGHIVGRIGAHRWLYRKLAEWGGENFAARFYRHAMRKEVPGMKMANLALDKEDENDG